MEQKEIDIYEILKGMPDGTPLYTPLCGNVEFTSVKADKENAEAIWTENKNGECSFNKNGKWMNGGEVLLFPSKEMRDWSKFFKKGDVLEFKGDEKVQGTCTFDKFEDETKTRFIGRFVKEKEVLNPNRSATLRTVDWVKSDDPAGYIRFVEERLGGKLNRETLEIEKTQPEFKDGDVLFVTCRGDDYIEIFNYSEENGDVYDHASLDTRTQELDISGKYKIYKDSIVGIRLATEEEKKQLFSALEKEGKAWNSEKKQVVDLKPAFEIGKLYVFNEEDEDGDETVIGKLIDKDESKGTLTFGKQYEIETGYFIANETFYLRISAHNELREATENEVELFSKHYSIWQEKEKEAMAKCSFKPFDKVLVRNGEKCKWLPAFFIVDRGEEMAWRYSVLSLRSGKTADFIHCIPFEGHEDFAFTDYDS